MWNMKKTKLSIIIAVFLCSISAYILYNLKGIAEQTAYVYFVSEETKKEHAQAIEAERARAQ